MHVSVSLAIIPNHDLLSRLGHAEQPLFKYLRRAAVVEKRIPDQLILRHEDIAEIAQLAFLIDLHLCWASDPDFKTVFPTFAASAAFFAQNWLLFAIDNEIDADEIPTIDEARDVVTGAVTRTEIAADWIKGRFSYES